MILAHRNIAYITIINDVIDLKMNKKNISKDIIDIHNSENVKNWTERLGCNTEQLFYCVSRVGKNSSTVDAFWTMNRDRLMKQIDY